MDDFTHTIWDQNNYETITPLYTSNIAATCTLTATLSFFDDDTNTWVAWEDTDPVTGSQTVTTWNDYAGSWTNNAFSTGTTSATTGALTVHFTNVNSMPTDIGSIDLEWSKYTKITIASLNAENTDDNAYLEYFFTLTLRDRCADDTIIFDTTAANEGKIRSFNYTIYDDNILIPTAGAYGVQGPLSIGYTQLYEMGTGQAYICNTVATVSYWDGDVFLRWDDDRTNEFPWMNTFDTSTSEFTVQSSDRTNIESEWHMKITINLPRSD